MSGINIKKLAQHIAAEIEKHYTSPPIGIQEISLVHDRVELLRKVNTGEQQKFYDELRKEIIYAIVDPKLRQHLVAAPLQIAVGLTEWGWKQNYTGDIVVSDQPFPLI